MTQTKKETTPEETPKEEMVEVPKGVLESIQTELKGLKEDRDMFMEMADERSKAKYFSRHQSKLPANVFLRTLTLEEKGNSVEKVVVGWRTTKDEVFKDPVTQRWQEIQKTEIIFEDGTSKEMFLLDWYRNYKQVKSTVISRNTDETTDNVMLKVKRDDNGREYEIDIRFIN